VPVATRRPSFFEKIEDPLVWARAYISPLGPFLSRVPGDSLAARGPRRDRRTGRASTRPIEQLGGENRRGRCGAACGPIDEGRLGPADYFKGIRPCPGRVARQLS
jgi:hypothetical protein